MSDKLTSRPERGRRRRAGGAERPAPLRAVARAGRRRQGRRRSRSSTSRDVNVFYGEHRAVRDVSLRIARNEITALIGPVGLRQVDLHPLPEPDERPDPDRPRGGRASSTTARTSTTTRIDPVQVRKRIGMVFQKPNPFPKSIYDNIAFGPRVIGMKGDMDEIVESALRRAALWDETKDRLKTNAFGMSGGQQQRLCIARALATEPDVLLMDEPCSALDPISTGRIEDLMMELKENYSIVIVTHNMQQAARVSDMTAFFTVELDETAKHRTGPRGRVRRDGQDLHEPRGQAHGGLRHGQVRLMAREAHRLRFQDELRTLEEQALGALDMVVTALDRTLEALEHQDIELASIVVADDDRLDGRYLEVHQGHPLAARAAGAGGRRPAGRGGAAARDPLRRADGRPVREHRQAAADRRPRGAGRRGDAREDRQDGRARALGGGAGQAGVPAARRRPRPGPGAPGRGRSTSSTASASSARSRPATTWTRASGR